jgi:hypothetical protein
LTGDATSNPIRSQSAGTSFAESTSTFLQDAFGGLRHLRPGEWTFATTGVPKGIAHFEQYRHLAEFVELLNSLKKDRSDIRAAFAADYIVSPDVMVWRVPEDDESISAGTGYLDDAENIARKTPLRRTNSDLNILHASVSCKWTLRSDRAQNARTEALNLIRNRKGRVPHVVFVTGEPMPSRIKSIAIGTGDVDCVYHMALNELERSAQDVGNETQQEDLQLLVDGRRLRDISDLPIDLAI